MFKLPESTKVHKVVPKNSFDSYCNSTQKAIFKEKILRITWLNKLSPETVNLYGDVIDEIQIFRIELKEKAEIDTVITIINKAIPYHIITQVVFGNENYITTSPKHKHPVNNDNAVIDYTFKSDWFPADSAPYSLSLKNTLDQVYRDFCLQFSSDFNTQAKTLNELFELHKNADILKREIAQLKSAITREKQFKIKLNLNIKLKDLEEEYKRIQF